MQRLPVIPSIEQWVAHLDGMVAGVVDRIPMHGSEDEKRAFILGFQDEFGSKQATDGALLSRVLGVPYQPETGLKADIDNRLWDALHRDDSSWMDLISSEGGLVDPAGYAIEHRTQIELCALHALWHLCERSQDDALRGRVDALVEWHTRELQPDNGINRPWGLHAFVVRSVEAGSEETRLDAMLHAQTLANNCCITLGRPDILSAVILIDSADALRVRLQRD